MSRYLTNSTGTRFGATRKLIESSDATAQAYVDAWGNPSYAVVAELWTCDSSGTLTTMAGSKSLTSGNGPTTFQVVVASDTFLPAAGGVAVCLKLNGVTVDNWYAAPGLGDYIPAGTHNVVVFTARGYDDIEEMDYTTVSYGNAVTYAPDGIIATLAPPATPTDFAASVSTDDVVLSWTKPAQATGYKVYRSTDPDFTPGAGNLIATLGDVATYADNNLATGTHYYRLAATNSAGESSATAFVWACIWPSVTPTTATTKYTFSDADTVSAGGYVFGEDDDFSRVRLAQVSRYVDTGAGRAVVRDGTGTSSDYLWATTWAAHDRSKTFEVESEVFIGQMTGAIDQGLVVYPAEHRYAHAIKPGMGVGGGGATGGGMGPSGTNAVSPATTIADWRGRWIKVRYLWTPASPDTVAGSCYIGGQWRSTGSFDFSAASYGSFPHPAVALHSWTNPLLTGILAYRNMRVVQGSLAAYSIAPSRAAGTIVRGQLAVDGTNVPIASWAADGTNTYTYSNVSLYIAADETESIYIKDASTNREIGFPTANVPTGLWAGAMRLRAKNVDWRVEDALGTTLASGTVGASETTTTVDLTSLDDRVLVPIVTLKDSTSLIRWLDLAWSETPPNLDVGPAVAAGSADAAAVVGQIVSVVAASLGVAQIDAAYAALGSVEAQAAADGQAIGDPGLLAEQAAAVAGTSIVTAQFAALVGLAAAALGYSSVSAAMSEIAPQDVGAAIVTASGSAEAALSRLVSIAAQVADIATVQAVVGGALVDGPYRLTLRAGDTSLTVEIGSEPVTLSLEVDEL